jgi:hypothetical protein
MTEPGEDEDEFGPYLEDAMNDREFRAAYERASREPTAVEARLARSRWARFGWRWLRTRGALAGQIAFDYSFSRRNRDHELLLLPSVEADRAARRWKGRIPW